MRKVLENQDLGQTSLLPGIFFGWYAYPYIAAISRVGFETQKSETKTETRLWGYETETKLKLQKNVFQDMF